MHGHFAGSEADLRRAARRHELQRAQPADAAQLADLRGHFEGSEADRAARLEVIVNQGKENSRLHAQIADADREREQLSADLDAAHAALATAESDRERLSTDASAMRTAQAELTRELETRRAHARTLEAHWTARFLKKTGLWPRQGE